nr:MAG TPA: hypothetical protein [Bacteriophage sp.]
MFVKKVTRKELLILKRRWRKLIKLYLRIHTLSHQRKYLTTLMNFNF